MREEVPIPVLIQVLGNIPGLRYFSNFYKYIIHTADPRAERYPLMNNPDTTAAIVLSYLIFCLIFGPKYMRNRQTPIFAQGLLCFYNLITIYINGFLALALTHFVFSKKHSLLCEPIDNSDGKDTTWIMTLLYIFHLSKIVELVDTIFLVWKKKNCQLSFLHVYHHSTIVAATWIGVKFAPGGTTAVICMINSWVHVFMYTYYQLTAIRVALSKKLKKFLTLVQMGQFCYTLAVCANGLWIAPCNYPDWILWWLFLYMLSFLMLFSNFFYETYAKKKANGKCSTGASSSATFSNNFNEHHLSDCTKIASNSFKNGTAIGIVDDKWEAQSIEIRSMMNGQFGKGSSSIQHIHDETEKQGLVHTVKVEPQNIITNGFESVPASMEEENADNSIEEIIFNERIELRRLPGQHQINAELKLLNNGIELVTNNFGEIPTSNQANRFAKESNKVRKFKKKKSQKKK